MNTKIDKTHITHIHVHIKSMIAIAVDRKKATPDAMFEKILIRYINKIEQEFVYLRVTNEFRLFTSNLKSSTDDLIATLLIDDVIYKFTPTTQLFFIRLQSIVHAQSIHHRFCDATAFPLPAASFYDLASQAEKIDLLKTCIDHLDAHVSKAYKDTTEEEHSSFQTTLLALAVNPILISDMCLHYTQFSDRQQTVWVLTFNMLSEDATRAYLSLLRKDNKSPHLPIYAAYENLSIMEFRQLWLDTEDQSESFYPLTHYVLKNAWTFSRDDAVSFFDFLTELENALFYKEALDEEEIILLDGDTWDEADPDLLMRATEYITSCVEHVRTLLVAKCTYLMNKSATTTFDRCHEFFLPSGDYQGDIAFILDENMSTIAKTQSRCDCLLSFSHLFDLLLNKPYVNIKECNLNWFKSSTNNFDYCEITESYTVSLATTLYDNKLLRLDNDIEALASLPWGQMQSNSALYTDALNLLTQLLKTNDVNFDTVKNFKPSLTNIIPPDVLMSVLFFEDDLHYVNGKKQLTNLLSLHNKTPMDVLIACDNDDIYKPKLKKMALSLLS